MEILYEDNHLIVVIKPAGVPSQGDLTGDVSQLDLVKEYIRTQYHKKGDAFAALIHRLDRPVGGVMVFGKTSKAAARLSAQFQERTIEKVYYAITEQVPNPLQDQLTHYLKQLPGKNIVKTYRQGTPGAQTAITEYKVLQTKGNHALIELHPLTGRRHQLRAQLAAIKCPIVGDVKYGKTSFLPDGSIALFAGILGFKHPVKDDFIKIKAPLPQILPWTEF